MNLVLQPYQWDTSKTINPNTGCNEIYIWCHDKDVNRFLIRIIDFRLTAYVTMPRPMEEKCREANCNNPPYYAHQDERGKYCFYHKQPDMIIAQWSYDCLHNIASDKLENILCKCRNKNDCYLHRLEVKIVYRKTLYFYQETDQPMFEVRVKSLDEMRSLKKALVSLKYTLLEDDIPAPRQLCTLKGIDYTSWINIRCLSIDNGDVDYVSTLKSNELMGEWNTISMNDTPMYHNLTIHMKILCFDIETYSHDDNIFPDPKNPKHEVFMISVIVQHYLQPETRVIYCLTTVPVSYMEGVDVRMFPDEISMITDFIKIIRDTDPTIITGFNIYGFDMKYIYHRMNMKTQFPSIGCMKTPHTILAKRYTRYDKETEYIDCPGRIELDVMHCVSTDYRLRFYSLERASSEILNEHKDDVSAKDMFEAFRLSRSNDPTALEKMNLVMKYCIQDSFLTIKLFHHLKCQHFIMERSSIVGVNPVDILLNGAEQNCISLMYNKAHSRGVIMEKRKANPAIPIIEGGLVMQPVVGYHEKDIADSDFSSLYPSIIQAYNICYTTLENQHVADILYHHESREITISQTEAVKPVSSAAPASEAEEEDTVKTRVQSYTYRYVLAEKRRGILPELVEELVRRRGQAKKEAELEPDPTKKTLLDQRQLGLKIAANALYGFTAMMYHGRYPLSEIAQTITGIGRQSVLKCAHWMQKERGCTIVYGDTDSIFYMYPDDYSPIELKAKAVEDSAIMTKELFLPPMKIEYEKTMRFIIKKKKNYAYLKADEDGQFHYNEKDILVKGMVPTRRDNCLWTVDIFNRFLLLIFKRKTIIEAIDFLFEAAEGLLQKNISIDQLTISKKLNSVYKSEGAQMKVFSDECTKRNQPLQTGSRIEFVVTKSDEKLVLGKRMKLTKLATVEEIDYDYYLKSMFSRPLDDIFAVAFNKQLRDFQEMTKKNIRETYIFDPMKPATIISDMLLGHRPIKKEEIIDFYRKIAGLIPLSSSFSDTTAKKRKKSVESVLPGKKKAPVTDEKNPPKTRKKKIPNSNQPKLSFPSTKGLYEEEARKEKYRLERMCGEYYQVLKYVSDEWVNVSGPIDENKAKKVSSLVERDFII